MIPLGMSATISAIRSGLKLGLASEAATSGAALAVGWPVRTVWITRSSTASRRGLVAPALARTEWKGSAAGGGGGGAGGGRGVGEREGGVWMRRVGADERQDAGDRGPGGGLHAAVPVVPGHARVAFDDV